MNWISSERGQSSSKQQRRSRENAQPRKGGTQCCPFSNSKQARQLSHLVPLHLQPPSWQLASFQRENKPRKMWFYLPSWQLLLLGLTAPLSLAPASLYRLKFIVQHSSAEIWWVKIHHICWDTTVQAPSSSLLLQDLLALWSVQSLAAGGSEALCCWEPKELAVLPFTHPRVAFPPSDTPAPQPQSPSPSSCSCHQLLMPQERGCGAALRRRGASHTEGMVPSAQKPQTCLATIYWLAWVLKNTVQFRSDKQMGQVTSTLKWSPFSGLKIRGCFCTKYFFILNIKSFTVVQKNHHYDPASPLFQYLQNRRYFKYYF